MPVTVDGEQLTSFFRDECLWACRIPDAEPNEYYGGCKLLLSVAGDVRGDHCEAHAKA